jgi:hypothetical protein
LALASDQASNERAMELALRAERPKAFRQRIEALWEQGD